METEIGFFDYFERYRSLMLKVQSVPGQIANEVLLGDLIPLLCDEIVAEYREVLARPKFKFDQILVETFLDGIISRGIFVDTVPTEEIIPDLKDIIFYANRSKKFSLFKSGTRYFCFCSSVPNSASGKEPKPSNGVGAAAA